MTSQLINPMTTPTELCECGHPYSEHPEVNPGNMWCKTSRCCCNGFTPQKKGVDTPMNPNQSPQQALAVEMFNYFYRNNHYVDKFDCINKMLSIITKHFPPLVEDKDEDEAFSEWEHETYSHDKLEYGMSDLEDAFQAGITYARNQALNKEKGGG